MEHPHHHDNESWVPAMIPPEGVVLDNHRNLLWDFNVIAQTVCMTVAGTLFFLRCYVRLGLSRMPRQWVLEDWMVCLSFCGLAIYSALTGLIMNNHGGVHQWNMSDEDAHYVLYLFWIETIIYGPFMFFTKLSILLLYLRLLVPTRWSFLWTMIHIFIAISLSFYTAITFVKIWQCDPQEKIWSKDVPGKCINLPVLLSVSGMFNTISDALILLVPIKACWNLRMSWQKKAGVCAIFTVGAIAPIFSAIGFAARINTGPKEDFTYNNPLILLWGSAEVTTGVVCACLPTIPSLLRGHNPKGHNTAALSRYQSTTQHSNAYVELDEILNENDRGKVVKMTAGGGPSPVHSRDGASRKLGNESKEALVRLAPGSGRKGSDASGSLADSGIRRTVMIEQTCTI